MEQRQRLKFNGTSQVQVQKLVRRVHLSQTSLHRLSPFDGEHHLQKVNFKSDEDFFLEKLNMISNRIKTHLVGSILLATLLLGNI